MLQSQRFGRYLLTEKLATGGMAEIFLAKLFGTAGFEKELVIKRILPHWSFDRDFTSMLIDEAKIAVQLNHPNIVQVYELGKEGEIYYIAMEYVEGVDLRRLIQFLSRSGFLLPLNVSLFIVSEILEGLDDAHHKKDSQGKALALVHRDISPQNILLSFSGQVKITDFGIAKASLQSHDTMTGVLKGKFAYMSPEQANQKPLDARSDLFAAAIILYELVTGERLFAGKGDIDTLDRVRRGEVSFSQSASEKIPAGLKEILKKGLCCDLSGRFQEAGEFRDAIDRFAEQGGIRLVRPPLVRFLQESFSQEISLIPKKAEEREAKTQQFLAETRFLEPSTLKIEEATLLESTHILVQSPFDEAQGGPSDKAEGKPFESDFPTLMVKEQDLFRNLKSEKRIWVSGGVVLFFVLIGFWFLMTHKGEEEKPEVITTQQVLAVSPPEKLKLSLPPAELTQVEPKVVSLPMSPEEKEKADPSTGGGQAEGRGTLSVQAIPWGYVSIDGKGKSETPLQKRVLEGGSHRLEVFYEPDNERVMKTITLKPNQHLFCIANFKEGEKGLTCSN